MILTVASFKGGVGKTTTAIHLTAFLNHIGPDSGPALLLDGDSTKNATAWGDRGAEKAEQFPFRVAPIEAAAKLSRQYEHIVIDTGQKPSAQDLEASAKGSDLLVIPAVPSALDTDGLGQTIRTLQEMQIANYRVLLCKVAPDEADAAAELRGLLARIGAPMFLTQIPRLKAYAKAAAAGVIVSSAIDRQGERAWEAYAAAGREIGL